MVQPGHGERRIRRRLERRWKKTRTESDETAFIAQKDYVTRLITNAKIDYFTDKCNSSTPKTMYNTINVLLNKNSSTLPDSVSYKDLADQFLSFFIEKVEKIRDNVSSVHAHGTIDKPSSAINENVCMSCFKPLSTDDVQKIIMQMPSKSCSLDSLPLWLVKENLPTLLPMITNIVNISLSSGSFPSNLKRSIITPVIKKSTSDPNVLKSYRPVANITFLSKMIEKVVTSQVTEHVDCNGLGEEYQSAYKRHHSTETARLRVKNDVMQSLDKGRAVLMVLLDMSAAFDTVDHGILLNRLESRFGINGVVNSWFGSYLSDRSTRVTIKNTFSRQHTLNYSLPQGSIIGPQCFTLYITPVGDIIRDHDISFHSYADDIQLFVEFDPKSQSDCQNKLDRLSSCIAKVNEWMVENTLQLNQEKTEFIVFAGSRVLPALTNIVLSLGDVSVYPSSSVKNLGVILDASLTMSKHINSLCRTVNFHLRNLWRIRRFITREACHNVVRGLVLSRLDYANSLLLGAREVDLK